MLLHASCISINHHGVLIAGPSGCGKSDLALRLIDAGAQLVADDQTHLHIVQNKLIASPPASIAGLLEVRHVGLMRLPYTSTVAVSLYIDIALADDELERLPEPTTIELLGCKIRRLKFPAFAASTPAKIRAVLQYPKLDE